MAVVGPPRPKAVAFDIIETTFSLEPLRPRLEALGLPPSSLEWLYAAALRDAMALACAGEFAPFLEVMKAALRHILARHGVTAGDDEIARALAVMRELPPQPGAREAFETLAGAGIRIVALSNGAKASTAALLAGAGLTDYVEHVLSVDDVSFSKPRREVYRHAVEATALQPAEIAMAACHPWDLNGARAAGLITGYVSRGLPYPSTVMGGPDVEGLELPDLARALVALPAWRVIDPPAPTR